MLQELMKKVEHKIRVQCSSCSHSTISSIFQSGTIVTCSKDRNEPFLPGYCKYWQKRTLLKKITSFLGLD